MSVCDKNCWDCGFRTTLSFYGIVCNYLGVMGRRRGCPAGKDCQEKIRGPKRESLEARLYRLPPSSSSSGMSGIGPKAQYPKDSGGTSSPNLSGGSDLGTKDAEDDLSTAARSPSPEGEAKAEEEERIAEKKRKKAEQHRAWVARNREHLREYQQEYRKKKMEEAKDGGAA